MNITDKQKKMLIGGGIAGVALLALSAGGNEEGSGFGGGGGGMTHGSTPLLGDAGKKETSAAAPVTNIFYPEAQPFTPDMSWFTSDPTPDPVLPPAPQVWQPMTDPGVTKKESTSTGETVLQPAISPSGEDFSWTRKYHDTPVVGSPTKKEASSGDTARVGLPKTGNIYTDAAASAIGGFRSLWSKFIIQI